jgi:hypothetical protein
MAFKSMTKHGKPPAALAIPVKMKLVVIGSPDNLWFWRDQRYPTKQRGPNRLNMTATEPPGRAVGLRTGANTDSNGMRFRAKSAHFWRQPRREVKYTEVVKIITLITL